MSEKQINTWLSEKGKKQIEFYTSSADVILVERKRTVQLLFDLFRYHFGDQKNLNILDLGCGDGSITQLLQEQQPANEFYLLDGSSVMLEKAKENLKEKNFHFIQRSFEKYLSLERDVEKYHFIFSSMAIHHLSFLEKSKLFAAIYRELKFSGLFLNIDVVHPPSAYLENWQFRMWVDWMNETLDQNGFEEERGKFDNLPEIYKNKPENQPSPLEDQLDILKKIGFRHVDCFYKYGIFCLYGGVKD